MDTLADPLRDNLNPPPRYQLESDSEDELGGGIYGSGNILKPTHPQSPTHSFNLNGRIDGLIGKPTIIGIGTAGSQFRRALSALSDSQDISIEADDYQIGTASCLSTSHVYIHISSKVPTSIHWTLSRWLLDTLKPTRLAIIDVYPTPAYISLTSMPHLAPPVRYLKTSTPGLALSLPKPNLGNKLEGFCPPNLLGTQTLSSAILPSAQASLLSGGSSLQEEAVLVLLPSPRIPLPAPKHLDTSALYDGLNLPEDSVWSAEELEATAAAVGIEGPILDSREPILQRQKRASRAEDGMYI